MIGITLVRISDSGNKRVMAERPGFSNRVCLGWVIDICDPRSMRVFENIMGNRSSFGTTLRFRFDINVSHNQSPLLLV